MGEAARRWAADLASWALPPAILDAAPESPWVYPPALFAPAEAPPTPSRLAALEALGDGGTVLDVGVGAGAASLPLAPPATEVVGVDESGAMLAAFERAAAARAVPARAARGSWPAVAAEVGPADVVVCHHVFYNVADLAPFARALTERARRRVVVELTATHPQSALDDLWRHFHGLERPTRPAADDAVAVLREAGLAVAVERWPRPAGPRPGTRAETVAFVRRRLCLPAERDPEVDALLGDRPPAAPGGLVTLRWDGAAGA